MPSLCPWSKPTRWAKDSQVELLITISKFSGFSDTYSSLVVNVPHLSTGYVSPQYHLVFDDLFETVFSTGNNTLIMIFATASLTLIAILTSMMTILSLMNLLFIICNLLMKCGWVNLSIVLVVMTLKNVFDLLKIVNESKILIKLLMNHLTHFQICLSSLIVTVTLWTIYLQSLFQRDDMGWST